MTGPLVPRAWSSVPCSTTQLDLATWPPGPCFFLSQGHHHGATDSRTMAWDMVDKGASVRPPPPGCREGRLFLEWGWGRGESSGCVCVCPSIHPCPAALCVFISVHVRLGSVCASVHACPAGPDLPGLLFWPQPTSQVLGVLGVVPNEVNLQEDQSPLSSQGRGGRGWTPCLLGRPVSPVRP